MKSKYIFLEYEVIFSLNYGVLKNVLVLFGCFMVVSLEHFGVRECPIFQVFF